MKEDNKNKINRRDFFKLAGAGTLASAAALYGCSGNKNNGESESAALGEIPTGKMTYRTNPNTGDRVSLLGYGCMRWPTRKRADGNGDEIDQEAVNDLIDYAIAHGVNYFDTSPAYVQGLSERATGIALKRHPREKFFLATKLSNFSPSTHSREESLAMYHRSFRDLQVDYIDYLLLHGIGMGGMEALRSRYLDNGMLDFLLKEREAGRIRNLGFSYHGDIEVFDYLLSRHDELKWDFVQIQLNYVDWRHAKEVNTRNTDAEYLYAELVKRNIPAVIMEPLLGGRLSRLNDHLMARLKQRRPAGEHGFLGLPICRYFPRCADRTERNDVHGASARQPAYLLPACSMYGRGVYPTGRYRPANAAIPHRAVQRLQILYAVPLWAGYSSHPAALQPLHQRGQRAAEQPRRELPRGTPRLPDRL